MLVVQTTIRFDPARREEGLPLVEDLGEPSRGAEGTVRYHAAEDLADRNTLRIFEQYEDADAAEAHTESETYRRFVEALPDAVEGEIETLQFEADAVDEVAFSAAAAVDALD